MMVIVVSHQGGVESKTTVVSPLTRDLTRGDSKNEGPRDPNPPKRNATMNRQSANITSYFIS
jgi:hypothetical protein